jgi:carbohydrate diacid regulator
MDISSANAHSIVTEISSILGQNVNLIDSTGEIIASTDPARVRTHHAGAARVVDEALPELVVESESEYPGTRRGLNLPVYLDGEIQGVIGVTGDYQEVVKYGHVLQKMTEILLRENRDKQVRKIYERIRERFLDEWILDGAQLTDGFVDRGRRLGIEAARSYWGAVSQIIGLAEFASTTEGQGLIDRVSRTVRRRMENLPGAVFSKTPNRLICLLPADRWSPSELVEQMGEVDAMVDKQIGVRLVSGVGDETDDVHRALLQADKPAVRVSRDEPFGLVLRDRAGADLDEIKARHRQAFIARVSAGCRPPRLGSG